MIDAATEVEILRPFRMESWLIGTIARRLRLHHSAVERIVRKPTDLNARRVRPTIIEPFMPFITEKLERFCRT